MLVQVSDSFTLFVDKLFMLLPTTADKSSTKQLEDIRKLPFKLTFGGRKVDKNLLSESVAVYRCLQSSQGLDLRRALESFAALHGGQVLNHSARKLRSLCKFGVEVAIFEVELLMSYLHRSLISAQELTDEVVDVFSGAANSMYKIFEALHAAVELLPSDVMSKDFKDTYSCCIWTRNTVAPGIRRLKFTARMRWKRSGLPAGMIMMPCSRLWKAWSQLSVLSDQS